MQKSEAIQLLGGSIKGAAQQIGITTQAIGGWPDELTPAIRDRVQAALWRKALEQGVVIAATVTEQTHAVPATQAQGAAHV